MECAKGWGSENANEKKKKTSLLPESLTSFLAFPSLMNLGSKSSISSICDLVHQ